MIKNYLKTAWRNLMKNKMFSFINILGLSLGLAVCFTILLYVQDELSYDRLHKKADRIMRVAFTANINGGEISESVTMPPVAQVMKADYAEVEDAIRIATYGAPKVNYNGNDYRDDEMAFVDPNFFNVFTIKFLKGNPATALSQPDGVVLTESVAKKYFGSDEPMGKTLALNNNTRIVKVSGLIADMPKNSHFHFALLGSMTGWDDAKSDSWLQSTLYTYLLLKPGADHEKLQAKLPGMVEKYMGPQMQRDMGVTLEQFRTKGNKLGFVLQPLTSIHLYSETSTEIEPGGNATYVYIFGAIAIFMLIVACINFINLSTASASKRAKEVGVRKVIGSGRAQLIVQFLSESILMTMIALLLAGVLVQIALPVFNDIAGKHLSFDIKPMLSLVALGLGVGLLAGIYPAFYLSGFKPIAVLKGKSTGTHRQFSLRSTLVVFQFFISVALIIGTIVVYQQMKFIQNKKLGYDKERLITIPNSWALRDKERLYKQELLNDPRFVNATLSWYKPAGPSNKNNALAYPEGHDNQMMKTIEYHVDEDYIPTLGIEMASGRNFSKEFTTDTFAMVINEAAAKAFGWNNTNAIGKNVIRENGDRGRNVAFHVVGVVKDFHYKSLHEAITPLLMTLQPEGGLIFKIKTDNTASLLAMMKQKWDSFNTGEPFTYAFMDDLYNKTYAAEQKTGTIMTIFSVLTILVACLGLFGLATYTAEQRTKEIGIRKVLGASTGQVTRMLSKEFLRLVLIASLIAFPAAWWAMNKWLQGFAYRTQISWWVFVIAGALTILIALITIGFRAVRAALANPVKSLRAE